MNDIDDIIDVKGADSASCDNNIKSNGGDSTGKHILKLKKWFVITMGKISEAVFPQNITCDVCGAELVADTRYNLCGACMEKLPFVQGHICLGCGAPMANEADYCLRCQANNDMVTVNRSPLIYEDEARKLIYTMKFGKKKYIAHTLGALMADEYIKRGMDCDIIVFVPMSSGEMKKRGFNQSELLAREVGQRLNLPVLPALIKTRDTSAQKELSGRSRADNLRNAFACVFKEVKRLKILLIDDVYTTGATANECANTLLKAGAKEVRVLTAAVTRKKLAVENNLSDGTADLAVQ